MVRPGEKYIIEIDSIYTAHCSDGNKYLYKVKGFNTLVFDENGIKKLTPYDEDKRSDHYFRGWDSGMEDCWDLAGEIINLPASVRDALFGYSDPKYIFRMYSADEAIKIMAKYKGEK